MENKRNKKQRMLERMKTERKSMCLRVEYLQVQVCNSLYNNAKYVPISWNNIFFLTFANNTKKHFIVLKLHFFLNKRNYKYFSKEVQKDVVSLTLA